MVSKSYPRKQVCAQKFHQKFWWLQNHFLENRYEPEIFIKNIWLKIFYGCKIISTKTGLNQKFSSEMFCVENVLWLQNHFLENRFQPKIFIENLFQFQNHFHKNRFEQKIFIKNILVENFLWLQNHFLENRLRKKFLLKSFFRKFFMVVKSFPREQVCSKISIKTFWSKIFLWLQNHFLENSFKQKIFIRNILVENLLWFAELFPRKQV